MSKAKLMVAAFFAVLALGALASSTASAATVGWLVNGTLLTGTQTAAIATTAFVDEKGILAFGEGEGEVKITCSSSTLGGVSPQIEATNKGSASSLIFEGCESTSTGECKLVSGKSIGTLPITTEVTLDGPLAVQGVFKPKSGTTFATIKLEGTNCAESGKVGIKGTAPWLAPTGQDERTLQLLSVNITKEQNVLQVGSLAASLKGSILLALVSLKGWSFM